MVKTCGKCGLEKDFDKDFSKNRTTKDGRNSNCKLCHRGYVNAHYGKNPKYYSSKSQKRVNRLKEMVNALKGKPCSDCGNSFNPWQMDFDHRDPSLKTDHISKMTNAGVGVKEILEELEKCDLVCANCHRDRTHSRGYVLVAQRKMRKPPKLEDASSILAEGTKRRWPPDEELITLVWIKSLREISRSIGVSDQAVKKHCEKRGIPLPVRRFHMKTQTPAGGAL